MAIDCLCRTKICVRGIENKRENDKEKKSSEMSGEKYENNIRQGMLKYCFVCDIVPFLLTCKRITSWMYS